MGDLSCPGHKIGQGHPRVMIYINSVDLYSLMLHAKFQNHRPHGSEEEDFLKFLLFIAMVAILLFIAMVAILIM